MLWISAYEQNSYFSTVLLYRAFIQLYIGTLKQDLAIYLCMHNKVEFIHIHDHIVSLFYLEQFYQYYLVDDILLSHFISTSFTGNNFTSSSFLLLHCVLLTWKNIRIPTYRPHTPIMKCTTHHTELSAHTPKLKV